MKIHNISVKDWCIIEKLQQFTFTYRQYGDKDRSGSKYFGDYNISYVNDNFIIPSNFELTCGMKLLFNTIKAMKFNDNPTNKKDPTFKRKASGSITIIKDCYIDINNNIIKIPLYKCSNMLQVNLYRIFPEMVVDKYNVKDFFKSGSGILSSTWNTANVKRLKGMSTKNKSYIDDERGYVAKSHNKNIPSTIKLKNNRMKILDVEAVIW